MTTLDPQLWTGRPGMAALLEALEAQAGRTRAVGGFVRDALLGAPPHDLDLATALPPDIVADRIRAAGLKAVPTGIAHGTITAVLADGPVEVTTLRRDVATDGRHAIVAFTDDWQADAARRDFTINALSADVDGRVHDHFGGLDDLTAGIVRFIGDPVARIDEDHLRILRFFRFHARFGGGRDPHPASLAACAARANSLMALSRERIADELLKLLALADAAPTVARMESIGILRPVVPEIDARGAARLSTLIAREQRIGEEPAALRRLGALLPPDAAIVDGVAARLRLSNAARRRLSLIATRAEADVADPRALAYRIGVEGARDRLLTGRSDEEALAAALSLLVDWQPPRLGVGGGELVAMGLPRGPIVAATLADIDRRWAAEGFPPRERLDVIVRGAVDQALRSTA